MRELPATEAADRFDQCDGRSESGSRCQKEADHEGLHSFKLDGTMPSDLPEEAVEAIARERYEMDCRIHRMFGGSLPTPPWKDADKAERKERLERARVALEFVSAALPAIRKQERERAVEELAQDLEARADVEAGDPMTAGESPTCRRLREVASFIRGQVGFPPNLEATRELGQRLADIDPYKQARKQERERVLETLEERLPLTGVSELRAALEDSDV